MVDRGPAAIRAANGSAVAGAIAPALSHGRRSARSARRGGFRASGSISSMAAPPRNIASSAIPTRSRRSSCLPKYCVEGKANTEVELFGRRYNAPIGVAPMGSAGLMWPGAEKLFAAEAQRTARPLCAGDARQCLDRGDRRHRAGRVLVPALSLPLQRSRHHLDLVRRADEAGAHVLVPTVDCAGKSKRPRDIRNGTRVPFPINPWTAYQVLTSPAWALQLMRNGDADHRQPRALCREGEPERDRRGDAAALRRQPHLGGIGAHPRQVETSDGAQGHPASAGRRARGSAGRRRHLGVESRRPPFRWRAGLDRRAAGDCLGGRIARHRC